MEQIADAVGVGRRTLFRYFPSKNDIPWGQFDESLRSFAAHLADVPLSVPVSDAVHRCVVAFNDFDAQSLPQHRIRMKLILDTPALQAHSALRYAAWRGVIEDYVASRLGLRAGDLLPRLAGHVSLALAVSSYEQWLLDPGSKLTAILEVAMQELRQYLR
jgi:mycofactocin system transcriptional regulator